MKSNISRIQKHLTTTFIPYIGSAILIGLFTYNFYTHLNQINMPQSPNQQQTHEANFSAIKATVAFIYTDQVTTPKSKTQITVPLKFSSSPHEIWLLLEQNTGNVPAKILLSHPKLINLNWSVVTDGYHYLWQKKPTFKSISNFMKSPPNSKLLLIDSSLKAFYKKTISGTELTTDVDINQFDYLFTTYAGLKSQANYFIADAVIDASFANVNNDKKYTWRLESKQASESNPYFLGPINIGYQ